MKIQCKLTKLMVFFIILALIPVGGFAKKKDKKADDKPVYQFTIEKEVKRTPPKNQYWTGTCWCFATTSFLESEAMRMGKEEVDLSEMFTVRNTYPFKATNYVRLHGTANHSQGGQSHDVINAVRRFGVVPESVYSGQHIEENHHNHGEMVAVLNGIVKGVADRKGRRVTPRWLEAYEAVLDVYMGKKPETFEYNGATYTPQSFAKHLGLDNLDDYVELTSYDIYPFYEQCRLEIPDNWDYNNQYYNLPIDELEKIADYALQNGYSIDWDGDVSERDFSKGRSSTDFGSGYAIVPEKDYDDMTKEERKKKITAPVKEKQVTQEMRSKTFLNFTTTDDHLMHIVGLAHDQNGTRFYLTKNSGGEDKANKGYVYLSQAYFRLKTTCIMVHKDAIPEDIKAKLKIK